MHVTGWPLALNVFGANINKQTNNNDLLEKDGGTKNNSVPFPSMYKAGCLS